VVFVSWVVAPTSPSIMYFTNQSFNSDAAQSIVVGIETRNVSLRCIFAGRFVITLSALTLL